jgi:hypothetical protein
MSGTLARRTLLKSEAPTSGIRASFRLLRLMLGVMGGLQRSSLSGGNNKPTVGG